ncbi:hypothetical protein Huta_0238 [Halorhabdus utahensis DSM 12940]|uniref:Uncharacterized protein n=2 Tax=Halorhabdus utahensis TaxID=146826 RepID=C7NPX9_HALUD|nr:hypothetical protein Huta_0238 [Halorhabdus utahensis DSM 12940]
MMPNDAFSAMGFCSFLDVLEDIDIVDPHGNTISNDLADLYGRAIVDDPESFWDIYFEMEVAHKFVLEDLEAYPIDESEIDGSGSDVLYKSGNRDYWVECKNKRQSTSYEWELERLGREISDRLWIEHSLEDAIGEDSFAIQVSSDQDISSEVIEESDSREQLIERLAEELSEMISDRESTREVEVLNTDFELELIGYHSGRYPIQLTDEGMEALNKRANLAKITNPYQHLGINPDIIDSNGHGMVHAENTGDNEIEIFSTYAFILDIPWDIPYHSWVFSTIDGVTEQFPDYPDIMVFVKIPAGIIYQMMNQQTTNHRGEQVSKWKRLEERIIGIYADSDRSDRVKSVVLMTDVVIDQWTDDGRQIMQQNAVKSIFNENVEDEIPGEFVDMVEGMNKIENHLTRAGRFTLNDQHL